VPTLSEYVSAPLSPDQIKRISGPSMLVPIAGASKVAGCAVPVENA
jgi:hypothetical protein